MHLVAVKLAGGTLQTNPESPLPGTRLRHGSITIRYMKKSDSRTLAETLHRSLRDHEKHFTPHTADMLGDTLQETTNNYQSMLHRLQTESSETNWNIPFVVIMDNKVVGVQHMKGETFKVLKEVYTASYLDLKVRGLGVGTKVRGMVLEFAFAHLGADTARSSYVDGNNASNKVSKKMGYRPDGTELIAYKNQRIVNNRLLLTKACWQQHRPQWLDGLDVNFPTKDKKFFGLQTP